MNLSLSEEQTMLADSVRRFVSRNYTSERRDLDPASSGFRNDDWQSFIDAGWLSLPFPKEDGGAGGNAVDLMVLLQELGKGLILEPLIPRPKNNTNR